MYPNKRPCLYAPASFPKITLYSLATLSISFIKENGAFPNSVHSSSKEFAPTVPISLLSELTLINKKGTSKTTSFELYPTTLILFIRSILTVLITSF